MFIPLTYRLLKVLLKNIQDELYDIKEYPGMSDIIKINNAIFDKINSFKEQYNVGVNDFDFLMIHEEKYSYLEMLMRALDDYYWFQGFLDVSGIDNLEIMAVSQYQKAPEDLKLRLQSTVNKDIDIDERITNFELQNGSFTYFVKFNPKGQLMVYND